MLPQRPLGCVCVTHISSLSSAPAPLTRSDSTRTNSPHILALKVQTNGQATYHNMHEIAHTDYFKAWTYPKVLYHWACERGNRIRAVVGWGRDLRRRRNAPSWSSSIIETERQRGAEMKRRILSSFIHVPPTALYLTLDLDESCYGVTWTWGGKKTQTDSGRERDVRGKHRYGKHRVDKEPLATHQLIFRGFLFTFQHVCVTKWCRRWNKQ